MLAVGALVVGLCSAIGSPTAAAAPLITATPDTGVAHNQTLEIGGAGFPSNSVAAVRQCVANATAVAPCDDDIYRSNGDGRSAADGTLTGSIVAFSVIRTRFGYVDCRTAPAACEIQAEVQDGLGTGTISRAPISFDPATATATPNAALVDGQVITVAGKGFHQPTGPVAPTVPVHQCEASVPGYSACDGRTGIAEVDATGFLTLRFQVHALIDLYPLGPDERSVTDCRSATCGLRAAHGAGAANDPSSPPRFRSPSTPLARCWPRPC